MQLSTSPAGSTASSKNVIAAETGGAHPRGTACPPSSRHHAGAAAPLTTSRTHHAGTTDRRNLRGLVEKQLQDVTHFLRLTIP